MITHKICPQCREDLPRAAFGNNKTRLDGASSWCKPCARLKWIEWKGSPKNRASRLASGRLYRYGLSPVEYEAMIEAQGNVCAICRTGEPGGRWGTWHVDHCHTSGTVRGLLCQHCNVGLGMFQENETRLKAAIGYIQLHHCEQGSNSWPS